MERRSVVTVVSVICVILVAGYLIAALFAPGLRYGVMQPPAEALDSPQYLRILEALVDARGTHNNRIEVLTSGEQYYPAELEAIRNAKQSVNIEAYIFQGRVTRQFVDALTQRAKAGVKVRIVLDAMGAWQRKKIIFRNLSRRADRSNGFTQSAGTVGRG